MVPMNPISSHEAALLVSNPSQNRALAETIARDLLTFSGGEQAQRLVQQIDVPTPRTLGGWSEVGLTDRIEAHLNGVANTRS